MSLMLMGCGGAGLAPPLPLSYTVDATGLILTIVLDRAATGTGAVTGTADGAALTYTYTSGSGTATWVYAITSGNPSGNPVLVGATVLLSASAGAWLNGGAASTAVSSAAVTNNSTVRNVGVFNSASSQYLSLASPGAGTLWTGGTGWAAGWIKPTDFAAERAIISTRSGNSGWYPAVTTGGQLIIRMGTGSGLSSQTSSVTMSSGSWYFWYVAYDGTNNVCVVSSTTGTIGQAFSAAAGNLTIGSRTNPDQYWLGRQTCVVCGTTPSSAIPTALYNGGTPIRPSLISAANRTLWGVSNGWLDTSLTADVIGSGTLTNNNTVTVATEQF